MATIRANRAAIDDRFNVLGFTVRSDTPLFEIVLATDPDLFRAERRGDRTPGNFYSSRILRAAPSQRGEAVYMVPTTAVARFVGQPRLYFGLATYRENDRNTPLAVRVPDRGAMYISLNGLTERGFRRSLRSGDGGTYGAANDDSLQWGGDSLGATGGRPAGGAGRGAGGSGAGGDAAYSDGYSDELWSHPPADAAPAASAPAPGAAPAPAAAPAPQLDAGAPAIAAQGLSAPARALLISSDYRPSNLLDALRAQLSFFVDSAMWYLGVSNTRVMPHAAICQIRRPDGSAEGALHGSGFFIGPRLIMTAAHVVDGQNELIVVRGKNGGGMSGGTEPFGRFNVRRFRKHGRYDGRSSDFDIALIEVPADKAVGHGQYFDLVEELTQSRREGVVVTGYAARWYAHDAIEHFVNDTIDPDKQHMMGGHIRALPTDETFTYNIQTLGGTSGSPVYWIEDTGSGAQAHMVGVHVAAHDATTNRGCRITAGKLSWIRQVAGEWGQSLSFALGATDAGTDHGDGAPSRALAPVSADTRGYGLIDSLRRQLGFFADSARWFFGVDDTRKMPYAAICQVRLADDSEHGSAFYIAPRLLLTAAHVVAGQSRLTIVPGKNGAGTGSATEPFGRFTATRFETFDGYGGNGDFDRDMALIEVPAAHAAPAGRFFPLVEELTQSRPEGVVVSGYAAYSPPAGLVGHLINGTIDPDKQHMMGGHVRTLPTDHTFTYDLQSLGGTSGSPVYWIEDAETAPVAHMVGVHVASFDDHTNRGCRITPAKLNWIRRVAARWGHTLSFSLGARDGRSADVDPAHAGPALSAPLTIGPEDVERARRYAPQWAELYNWRVPAAVVATLGPRNMQVQSIHDAHGELNLDLYEVRCTRLPTGMSEIDVLRRLRTHLNDFVDTRNSEFEPYEAGDATRWNGASPTGAVIHIDVVGPDNATVVASLVEDRRWRFSTIRSPRADAHPVSGHREFGVRRDGEAWVFYTRGADRSTHGIGETLVFAGADHLWRSLQSRLTEWINANGGSASAPAPFSERFHPEVVRILYGTRAQSLAEDASVDDAPSARAPAAYAQPLGFLGREIPLDPGAGGQSIHPDALHVGDIIVSTARHPISFGIRLAQGRIGRATAISHAMLYVGDGKVIEAVGDGVREVALATALGDAILAVAYRDQRVDAAKAARIVAFAREQLGKPYDVASIVRHGYRALNPLMGRAIEFLRRHTGSDENTARSFYCSQLVFAAFREAGVPLNDERPDASTPGDLVDLRHGRLDYVGHLIVSAEILGVALSSDGGAGHAAAVDPPRSAAPAADGPVQHAVQLIPQPDKNSCWAAAMAMLISFRRLASHDPEALVREIGASLGTSYDWDLLEALRARHRFEMIRQPSNASVYHSPRQWAQWLGAHGPLWVVIVGAPHAVVVSGIRGDLDDASAAQVHILNPWDTRVQFDDDPVAFHPANRGYADWMSFADFARDFGEMAEPDYGNWRILHLPASSVQSAARSLSAETHAADGTWREVPPKADADPAEAAKMRLHLAPPPEPFASPAPVAQSLQTVEIASAIVGATMERVLSNEGGITWELEQMRGFKHPNDTAPATRGTVRDGTAIRLTDWPIARVQIIPGTDLITDDMSAGFVIDWQYDGKSLGNVRISPAGRPNDAIEWSLSVRAQIMDDNIVYPTDNPRHAALRIRFVYRFTHWIFRDQIAIRDVHLFGDGTYRLAARWEQ